MTPTVVQWLTNLITQFTNELPYHQAVHPKDIKLVLAKFFLRVFLTRKICFYSVGTFFPPLRGAITFYLFIVELYFS